MDQVARRVTIADVAERAGVSKTAVSFAFNNPDRLNVDTASRILDIASELGYRPDPVARMLTQRRTGSIGILTPQDLSVIFTNPFFGSFSAGIAAVSEERGYGLHFISPLHGSLTRAIHRATVDGVVAIGLTDDHPEIDEIRRAGLPMVLVDSATTGSVASIDIDDEGGARLAAAHVLELGHRDIAVLAIDGPRTTGSGGHGVVGRRLRGYTETLAEAGLELASEAIAVGPASIDGGSAAFDRLWDAGQPTDGRPVHERRDGDRRHPLDPPARRNGPRPDQRRRLRRYRPGRLDRSAPDHRPPARPGQG